jgi:hypothetical protein
MHLNKRKEELDSGLQKDLRIEISCWYILCVPSHGLADIRNRLLDSQKRAVRAFVKIHQYNTKEKD